MVARVGIALQKLIVRRAVSFLFGNDVVLNATADAANQKAVMEAVKKILSDNKSKSLNKKLARHVFSCTEAAEVWFPVANANERYGFKSKYKLRSAILSPLNGDILYPCFDEYGDLIAFSREYEVTPDQSTKLKYFETYTDAAQYKWVNKGKDWEPEEGFPRKIEIGKIPVIYVCQPQVEWEDVQELIDRLEKLLSNFADTNDYHASPKIFVKGTIKGFSKKGESGAIIEGDDNAEASYLSWNNAPESVKLEIQTLLNLIYTITQTPDISFDNVKGLGAMSGIALKLLFLDAHLKVNDKCEIFDEHIQRRLSVIKAFVGSFSTTLKNDAESLSIEHEITPYMIDDVKTWVETLTTATGGKQVLSQKQGVKLANLVPDGVDDFEQIQQESKIDVFNPGN